MTRVVSFLYDPAQPGAGLSWNFPYAESPSAVGLPTLHLTLLGIVVQSIEKIPVDARGMLS